MDWVGVRVKWGMYGVRVCVAAKVRMIPMSDTNTLLS